MRPCEEQVRSVHTASLHERESSHVEGSHFITLLKLDHLSIEPKRDMQTLRIKSRKEEKQCSCFHLQNKQVCVCVTVLH